MKFHDSDTYNTQHGIWNDGELPSELLKQYPSGMTELWRQSPPKTKPYPYTQMEGADPLQVLCLEVCLVLACVGVVAFVFIMLMLT